MSLASTPAARITSSTLASAALLAFRAAAAVSLSATTPVETSAASGAAFTSALPVMVKVRAGAGAGVCADAGETERNSAAASTTHVPDRRTTNECSFNECLFKQFMWGSCPVIRSKHHGPIKMGKIGRRRPRLRNSQPRAELQCRNRDLNLVFFVPLTTFGSLRSHA